VGRHRKRRASHRLSRRTALLAAGLLIPGTGGAAVLAATTDLEQPAVPSARSHPAARPGAAMTEVPGTRSQTTDARPTPTASEATASPDTAPSAAPAAAVTFAPYADVLTWPPLDFAKTSARTGVRKYTLGFVAAGDGCTATWGGLTPLSDPVVRKRIKKVPGETIVSFGGPHATELAGGCTGVDALTEQYRSVLAAAGTEQIDFYLTDAALADGAAAGRRAEALARLQHDRPGVRVSFTLQLHHSGLADGALAALRSAATAGVDVSIVDLLPAGGTGPALIASATAVHAQLERLYHQDADTVWRRMGLAPVVGVTDTGAGFQPADARQIRAWAGDRHLGRLSMWSMTRDAPCTPDTTAQNDTCSGLDEDPGVFSRIFQGP
jgi:chitinase